MPLPLAPLLGVGASLASTYLASRTQRRNVDRTNRANRELAEYAYQRDLEMWNRQNEYNTPSAQMQRFKEAGLNPNLIYGQGTPGNAQQMPKYNAPNVDYSNVPEIDPLGTLQAYQNLAQKSSQINYTKQQTETEFMETWLRQTQNSNLMTEGQIKSLQYDYLLATLHDRTSYQKAQLIYKEAQTIIEKKRAEWARQGINPNDATWLRLTLELLQSLGIEEKRLKSLKSEFKLN